MGLLVDAVQCGQDGMNGNFRRLSRQFVSTEWSAGTPDQACSAKCSQHLVEIGFRYILPGGDLLAMYGTLPNSQGELKERPDSVVRAT
jgi:hypothetical protein